MRTLIPCVHAIKHELGLVDLAGHAADNQRHQLELRRRELDLLAVDLDVLRQVVREAGDVQLVHHVVRHAVLLLHAGRELRVHEVQRHLHVDLLVLGDALEVHVLHAALVRVHVVRAQQDVLDLAVVAGRLAFGVLHPVARRPGEVDDDEVGPAVRVDVLGPAREHAAVVAETVLVVLVRLQLVRGPVRRFVPVLAVEHIDLAVLVHVADGDPLGPELRVQNGLFPGDLDLVGLRRGGRRRQRDRHAERGQWENQCESAHS